MSIGFSPLGYYSVTGVSAIRPKRPPASRGRHGGRRRRQWLPNRAPREIPAWAVRPPPAPLPAAVAAGRWSLRPSVRRSVGRGGGCEGIGEYISINYGPLRTRREGKREEEGEERREISRLLSLSTRKEEGKSSSYTYAHRATNKAYSPLNARCLDIFPFSSPPVLSLSLPLPPSPPLFSRAKQQVCTTKTNCRG